MGKETNKRSLSDLTSVIGKVAVKNKDKLINNNIAIEHIKTNTVDRTSEFNIKTVAGYELEARVPKVNEGFMIKPSLKKMVEEIVADYRAKGHKITKGIVYNLLIENALNKHN